mgnify:FL=1
MSTKYREIYNIFKEEIENGTLKPNQKISDELTLCKKIQL